MRATGWLGLAVLGAGLACSTTESSTDCESGERFCAGACVNITSNSSHCGGCGNVCPTGQQCRDSTCQAACGTGLVSCSGSCVDVRYNPAHCGGCNQPCASGQHCADGVCTGGSCPPDQTMCGTICVDLRDDPDNCGSCGHACPGPCFEGACQDCPVGFDECGGRCVDLQKDEENCGTCGHECPAGQVCEGGTCTLNCPEGLDECSGSCVVLASDHANCGSCGHACAAAEVCSGGACTGSGCPAGLVDCSGSCVDTDNDPRHCGSCTNACPADQACVDGACGILCPAGQENCAGRCVTLATDRANCGSCGHACREDETCVDGTCACPSGREECAGVCVDTRIDPENCGDCGVACTGAEACDDGACTVSCPSGTTACEGYCVDTSSDRNHCGACGHACATSETCVGGACSSGGGVAGDTCAAPINVTGGGRFTGTTAGAGADYSGGCGGTTGREVVFTYTLTETTDVYLNTFNSAFDTLVYVRSSCGGGGDIACIDDSRGTLRSEIMMLDQAPGTYYVVLDAFSASGSGNYVLDIYFSAPTHVGGDACGEPKWVDIATVTAIRDDTCPLLWYDARDDTRSCSRGSGGKDMVYYFVVPTTATYTFSTCDAASWDTILDLRRVCSDEASAASVACDDDTCDPGLQSTITATLDPGVYYLWIDAFSESACGGFTINVTR